MVLIVLQIVLVLTSIQLVLPLICVQLVVHPVLHVLDQLLIVLLVLLGNYCKFLHA